MPEMGNQSNRAWEREIPVIDQIDSLTHEPLFVKDRVVKISHSLKHLQYLLA